MKHVSLFLLLALCRVAAAQTPAQPDPNAALRLNTTNILNRGTMIERIDTRYEGQHGSPYLLPNWTKGRVDLLDGRQFTDVPLKFNAYRQELTILRPRMGNDSIVVDQRTVAGFFLADSSSGKYYPFRRYPTAKTNDPALRDGYFLVLYAGKSALLKRVAKTLDPANYQGGYSPNVRYDSYEDAFSYYLLKPDQTLLKVKLARKPLLEALSDRGDALKSFVDSQKLGLKTEADAVALVKQYDSL